MGKRIRVQGIKRKEIDEEKMALAFLLLAKTLHEQKRAAGQAERDMPSAIGDDPAEPEAA